MTTLKLPPEAASHTQAERLSVALSACTSAGAALLGLRGQPVAADDRGDQLKTSVDQAAEGWVLGLLRASFPEDRFLAEESHDADGQWEGGTAPYWTIDALDGTRSFVEGYAGFCVQVAYVADGHPCLGVVCEPVAHQTFIGVLGAGSWRLDRDGAARLKVACTTSDWPSRPRFVDSIPPEGPVGRAMQQLDARFVECGSVGLKICRVAEGRADVYAKRFRFKLWDVAPGAVILKEAGGTLGTWEGSTMEYMGHDVVRHSLVATPAGLWEAARKLLQRQQRAHEKRSSR